jgi:hypothetical protein
MHIMVGALATGVSRALLCSCVSCRRVDVRKPESASDRCMFRILCMHK